MPRKQAPWYRASRKRWYVTMNGQQVDLGISDPRAVAEAFAAWQALQRQMPTVPPPQSPTIAQKIAAYLERMQRKVKLKTLTNYRYYLAIFQVSFGTRTVVELTADPKAAEQIEDDAQRATWSSSTRNAYLGAVGAFLRWIGITLRLHRPPKQSAGAKSVISDETHAIVLTHCHQGDWRAVVEFLWFTGCRPSECAAVTVECVDWTAAVARLVAHKGAAHGGDRLIYLSAEALAVLERQRAKYGTGYLFRSQDGVRLTQVAFSRKFERLTRRIGRRVIPYGYRHTYATRALKNGASDTIVAALLGHKSTTMIHAHYSHVSEMGRALKDAADKIGKLAG